MISIQVNHGSPIKGQHQSSRLFSLGHHYSQILCRSAEIETSGGITQTNHFGLDDVVGPEAVDHDHLVHQLLTDMFLADSAFDVPADGDIIDLDQIHKGFLLSDPTDLSIDNISNLNVEALHWEFIFNKVDVALAADYAYDGGEDVLLV